MWIPTAGQAPTQHAHTGCARAPTTDDAVHRLSHGAAMDTHDVRVATAGFPVCTGPNGMPVAVWGILLASTPDTQKDGSGQT